MPITSARIGRNRHMSISHRRDKPFIMAVIARYTRVTRCHEPNHGPIKRSDY